MRQMTLVSFIVIATLLVATVNATSTLKKSPVRGKPLSTSSTLRVQDAAVEKLAQLVLDSNDEIAITAAAKNVSFFQGFYTVDEVWNCVHANPYTGNCTCDSNMTTSRPMAFISKTNALHFFIQCTAPRATDFGQYGGAFQCNSAAKDGSSCDECVVRNPGTNGCSCPANTGFVARKVVVPMVKKDSNHVVSTINFCVPPNFGTPSANKPTPVAGVCLGSDDPDCYCNTQKATNFTKRSALDVLQAVDGSPIDISFCVPNCTAQQTGTCGGYCGLCLSQKCYDPVAEACCSEGMYPHTCGHDTQCCPASDYTTCCGKDTSCCGYGQSPICLKPGQQCCYGDGPGAWGESTFTCSREETCCPVWGGGFCCSKPTAQCCSDRHSWASCYAPQDTVCGLECHICRSGQSCNQTSGQCSGAGVPANDLIPPPKKRT